jgi:hypothetical protein
MLGYAKVVTAVCPRASFPRRSRACAFDSDSDRGTHMIRRSEDRQPASQPATQLANQLASRLLGRSADVDAPHR